MDDTKNKPVTYTQEQVDKMLDEQRETQSAMFTQAQVDEMLAKQANSSKAETARQVAEAKGATAKPVKVKVAKPLTIDKGKDSPALVALTGATQVVFVDDEDRPLADLPATTFAAADFKPAGDNVTLDRDVEFPKEIPATEISGAFLLDGKGDPVGKATLVMPFAIGGGRSTKLAKSTLQFAG